MPNEEDRGVGVGREEVYSKPHLQLLMRWRLGEAAGVWSALIIDETARRL